MLLVIPIIFTFPFCGVTMLKNNIQQWDENYFYYLVSHTVDGNYLCKKDTGYSYKMARCPFDEDDGDGDSFKFLMLRDIRLPRLSDVFGASMIINKATRKAMSVGKNSQEPINYPQVTACDQFKQVWVVRKDEKHSTIDKEFKMMIPHYIFSFGHSHESHSNGTSVCGIPEICHSVGYGALFDWSEEEERFVTYLLNSGEEWKFRNRRPVRKLSMVSTDGVNVRKIANALQIADPIAIVQNVDHHLDCTLLCSRHKHCRSSSYILEAKYCLLSSTTLSIDEVSAWDKELLPSVYIQVMKSDDGLPLRRTSLHHGQSPAHCGTNAFSGSLHESRQKRIIDGWTPEPYSAPWVGILLKKRRVRCTAFLVSKNPDDTSTQWVLSAKHCFNEVLIDDEQGRRVDLKDFGLLFGAHDIRFATQHMVYRTIDGIIAYPDEGLKPKDVILIKMAKPIKFSGYINALCLPDSVDEHMIGSNASCTTCGFGATKMSVRRTIGSRILQCVEVEPEAADTNHDLYSDWNSVVRLKSTSFGPYHDDSGSPVFCNSDDTVSFLFAIITAGRSTIFKTAHSVAARISYFMNFIDNHMSRNIVVEELCCPSKK